MQNPNEPYSNLPPAQPLRPTPPIPPPNQAAPPSPTPTPTQQSASIPLPAVSQPQVSQSQPKQVQQHADNRPVSPLPSQPAQATASNKPAVKPLKSRGVFWRNASNWLLFILSLLVFAAILLSAKWWQRSSEATEQMRQQVQQLQEKVQQLKGQVEQQGPAQ